MSIIKEDNGLISGGGVKADLLWTNSTPTQVLSGLVSLDLTNYAAVLIESRYNASGASKSIVYVEKGTVDGTDGKLSRTYASSNQMIVEVSDSGVKFNIISGVNACIPTRIWGVSDSLVAD